MMVMEPVSSSVLKLSVSDPVTTSSSSPNCSRKFTVTLSTLVAVDVSVTLSRTWASAAFTSNWISNEALEAVASYCSVDGFHSNVGPRIAGGRTLAGITPPDGTSAALKAAAARRLSAADSGCPASDGRAARSNVRNGPSALVAAGEYAAA